MGVSNQDILIKQNTPLREHNSSTFTDIDAQDAKLSMAYMYIAFFALFLGAIAGVLQGLVRAGIIQLPAQIGYYQLLSAHGVLLALVLSTGTVLATIMILLMDMIQHATRSSPCETLKGLPQ